MYLEVGNDYLGTVTEMLGVRRGQLQHIRYGDDGTVYCEFIVPTRGTLGFRQPFLTATRGTGIFHTLFRGYEPYMGDIENRTRGSLVALETGSVKSYALQGIAAARVVLCAAGRRGLFRPDRGRAYPRRGLGDQRLQGQADDQLPRQAEGGHRMA